MNIFNLKVFTYSHVLHTLMVHKILDIGLQSPETTSQNFQLPYIFCKVDLYIVVTLCVTVTLLFPKGDRCTQVWPYLFPIDTFVINTKYLLVEAKLEEFQGFLFQWIRKVTV